MKSFIFLTALLPIFIVSCNKDGNLPSSCKEKPDPGNCEAYMPRYYYDKDDQKCKEFIWGGCEGNVPFETLEECQQECDCNE